MKALSIAGCLGSVLLLLAAASAESVPPFSLTITAPQPEVKAGSGVKVDATLTNNSTVLPSSSLRVRSVIMQRWKFATAPAIWRQIRRSSPSRIARTERSQVQTGCTG